jgi:hypothetical protein
MSDERPLASVGDIPEAQHKAQPAMKSWTRKSDGAPADLFEGSDYPLNGICMFCQGLICAESFLSIWRHSGNAV